MLRNLQFLQQASDRKAGREPLKDQSWGVYLASNDGFRRRWPMNEPKQVMIKLNPNPEEYVDEEGAFLRAVGACVTCWAFVDRQLFRLFRFGLDAPTHTAALIYYGQNTIGRSLAQVDTLLSAYFADTQNEKHQAQWKSLHSASLVCFPCVTQ
jgi:hypothetical protein